jgi:hypothetical protein
MCLRAEELGSESSSSDSFCTPFAVHTGQWCLIGSFHIPSGVGKGDIVNHLFYYPFIWRSNGLGPPIQ